MPRRNETPRSVCPVSYALEIFGDRWSLVILRDVVLEHHRRYRELLATDGLATNVLADRLKRLERRGLISRTRDPADARQYIYKPTAAAISLIPMLLELIVWGAENSGAPAAPELIERFKTDRDALIAELQRAATARL